MRHPYKSRQAVSLPTPANDNDTRRGALKVVSDWPSMVPITPAELSLLETHMTDLVSEIAANDNELSGNEENP